MSSQSRKMTPRSFYNVAASAFSKKGVAGLLKVGLRDVQRWTADPLTTCPESQSASPMERHRELFARMEEVGLGYAVHGVIRYLQSAVLNIDSCEEIEAPLPTMLEEQLADHKRLADLQRGIDDRLPLAEVRVLERSAIEEIQRTVAKYVEDNELTLEERRS